MNRLQLATLLSWAGKAGLQGRKRLQKIVFFLQQAGSELDCRYTLHHFGPYSRDVADACDEMVAAGLIEEEAREESWGTQYDYRLTPIAKKYLAQAADESMQRFHDLGTGLVGENLWQLELGSTILFFFEHTDDWDRAFGEACEFKKVDARNDESRKALELAKRVRMQAGN